MKKIILLFIIFLSVSVSAQNSLEKITPALYSKTAESKQSEKILIWVFFKDKGRNLSKYYNKPARVVSDASLTRRLKVLPKDKLINEIDLPVNKDYIIGIKNYGAEVKHVSRWFNGITIYINKEMIPLLAELPFVKQLDIVNKFRTPPEIKDEHKVVKSFSQPLGAYKYDYGSSFTQLQQINVPAVHEMGITGKGVNICLMDAGVSNLSHEVFSSMKIIAQHDFVNNDNDVENGNDQGSGEHGLETLSAIGGFKEGTLIGPAFEANFILAKTENTFSETPLEEDNWIAAMEWADSIGVDVTSTSLVYLDFDAPYHGYSWEDMNGNTARITIASDLAVKRGIVVINAAGNEGYNKDHNTLGAPADGDSVIAVGAVTSNDIRVSFSSVGNTIDGRIKPDVMAMGSGVVLAKPFSVNEYTTGSGTSFAAPLVAGVAGLILSINPNLTPMQVRDALRNTANNHLNPNREYGWGIIDAAAALNYYTLPVEFAVFNAVTTSTGVLLNWSTATESNNAGFKIERSPDGKEWTRIGFVKGNGTTTELHSYSFKDKDLISGKYYYRLDQKDYDGKNNYSEIISVEIVSPEEYSLEQNYPNPFNPTTTIKYSIPKDEFVTLTVYNVLGNIIATLVNDWKTAGSYEVTFNAEADDEKLSSGIYFYKLKAGNDFIKINKMTFLK